MFPSPMLSRLGIINRIRPTISNILSKIRFISDLNLFNFVNFMNQVLNRKTNSRKIICSSILNALLRCIHNLNGSLDSIIDKHHGQSGILLNKTLILALFNGLVKDSDSIIRGATSR